MDERRRLDSRDRWLLLLAATFVLLYLVPLYARVVEEEDWPFRWPNLVLAAGCMVAVAVRRRREAGEPADDVSGASGSAARPEGASPPEPPTAVRVVHAALTVAWIVGLVAVVGAIVAGVVGPRTFFEGPSGGLTVAVRFDAPVDDPEGSTPTGSYSTSLVEGSVTIADPDGRARLTPLVVGGLGLAALLVVVHQLRALFATAIAGDPFVTANARRLRVVGFVTIAAGLAWRPLAGVIVTQTAARVDVGGPPVAGPPSTWAMAAVLVVPGAVLVALAEVFRRGSAMRAEQELTV